MGTDRGRAAIQPAGPISPICGPMRSRRPATAWFPDPGWLFVLAGLVMCAAVVLVPAENDLHDLEGILGQLRRADVALADRLHAHAAFLDDVDRGSPDLVRRLAVGQLNLVPEGRRAVLLTRTAPASITDWIDGAATPPRGQADAGRPPRLSLLSRLTDGPYRLWLLGGSMLSVFMGLLIGERPPRRGSGPPDRRQRAARRGRTGGGRDEYHAQGDRLSAAVERGSEGMESTAVPGSASFSPDHMVISNDVDDEVDVLDEDEIEALPEGAAFDDDYEIDDQEPEDDEDDADEEDEDEGQEKHDTGDDDDDEEEDDDDEDDDFVDADDEDEDDYEYEDDDEEDEDEEDDDEEADDKSA